MYSPKLRPFLKAVNAVAAISPSLVQHRIQVKPSPSGTASTRCTFVLPIHRAPNTAFLAGSATNTDGLLESCIGQELGQPARHHSHRSRSSDITGICVRWTQLQNGHALGSRDLAGALYIMHIFPAAGNCQVDHPEQHGYIVGRTTTSVMRSSEQHHRSAGPVGCTSCLVGLNAVSVGL